MRYGQHYFGCVWDSVGIGSHLKKGSHTSREISPKHSISKVSARWVPLNTVTAKWVPVKTQRQQHGGYSLDTVRWVPSRCVPSGGYLHKYIPHCNLLICVDYTIASDNSMLLKSTFWRR